jgi:hypothetical protein
MSFATLCREADKKQRRKLVDARLNRLRRLLSDDVSLVQAHAEISADHLKGRAAASTVEALMYSLRSGVAALARSDSVYRLSELSDAQMREVAVRVQKFKPHIAPAWAAEDVQVLVSAWSEVHG